MDADGDYDVDRLDYEDDWVFYSDWEACGDVCVDDDCWDVADFADAACDRECV